jgi:hypothetical protein
LVLGCPFAKCGSKKNRAPLWDLQAKISGKKRLILAPQKKRFFSSTIAGCADLDLHCLFACLILEQGTNI